MSFKKAMCIIFPAAIIAFAGCGTESLQPQRTAPTRRIVTAQPTEAPPSRIVAPPRHRPPRTERPQVATRRTTSQITSHQTPTPAIQIPPQTRELATHETEFNAKEKNRNTNITRASASIDGHIVQPGETFSYNETVGPTNEKRGYKKGIIFIKGKKKEGVGGGVCQVSTTLYNAAANAGLEILERHDHSKPVTYAKAGKEAATSYGGIDFKFKNNKSFPVKINASVGQKNGTISVTISAV